ncbi:sensor domain-containing protein [Sphaerisporangium sp. NPDC005289]|uniref:sensor histidine kinase n=1 Tax=Sphaerisporangium sp. NPDC005289 TaxID=3155247 RepID=UPI0033A139D2
MLARTALEALTRRPSAFLRSPWPWRSLAYLLSSAYLALAAAALAALAYLYGLAVACAVLPPLVVVSGLAAARLERARLGLVDLRPTADPHRPPERPGVRAWFTTRLREQATWREMALLPVAMVMWFVDLGVAFQAIWLPLLLLSGPLQPTLDLLTGWLVAAGGLLLFPVAAYVVTAWAGTRASIVRAVLAPDDTEVVRSRARLVDAFESERRRIERDLHDGAQQRLVSLTMKLGLALLDLPPGSPAAVQIDQAHGEAKRALAELRELIRGIHPHVLTDRGLPAAVLDVAGRSPVPVEVDISLPARLPGPIEVTAYYVTSEALANVARHSAANHCLVRGRLLDDTLVLQVEDDGVGGADPAAGSGLSGLADRLAVVDGVMTLSSPPGGPTSLRVEIPCPLSA